MLPEGNFPGSFLPTSKGPVKKPGGWGGTQAKRRRLTKPDEPPKEGIHH